MAGEEIHHLLVVLGDAQDGVRQFLLGGGRDPGFLLSAFQHRGVDPGDAVPPGESWFFLGVHKFNRQLRREGLIRLEQVAVGHARRALIAREDRRLHLSRKLPEGAGGLRRKRKFLCLREVPANVMADREEIHDPEDGPEQDHHDDAVESEPYGPLHERHRCDSITRYVRNRLKVMPARKYTRSFVSISPLIMFRK